jgi:superkiller protein 3
MAHRCWMAVAIAICSLNLAAQQYPDREVHQDSITNLANNPQGFPGALSSGTEQKLKDAAVYAPELTIPDNARANYQLGLQFLQQGKADRAEKAFRRAAELYPKYSSAYNGLGVALRNQNKLEDARTALEQALLINPNNAPAQKNLAALLLGQGKTDEAEQLLRKATNLQPHEPTGFVMLAYLELALKHFDAAIAASDAMGRKNWNKFPVIHMIRASALERNGHPKEAIAEYQSYLKSKPDESHAAIARHAIDRLKLNSSH